MAFVRAQLVAHPGVTRRALSRQLCEAWDWRQPNGTLCDALCRSLLLRLHRAGHVTLPPGRYATMLGEKIDQHAVRVWLVNTGWTGGGHGVGTRTYPPRGKTPQSRVSSECRVTGRPE